MGVEMKYALPFLAGLALGVVATVLVVVAMDWSEQRVN